MRGPEGHDWKCHGSVARRRGDILLFRFHYFAGERFDEDAQRSRRHLGSTAGLHSMRAAAQR